MKTYSLKSLASCSQYNINLEVMERKNNMDKIKQLANDIKAMSRDNPERKIKLQQLIELYANELLPEAKIMVEEINKKPETTKSHYGDYLQIIGNLHGLDLFAMSRALVLAGADPEGLRGASMAMGASL